METIRKAGLLTVLILSNFSLLVHGQPAEQTKDQLAFDNAHDLYESEKLEASLLAFYEFMVIFPQSPLKPRAHFNIGYISRELKKDEAAKVAFMNILEMDYNELDENSLMEPYALYKHNSCRHLAEIFLEEKNYKEADKFISMFDQVYPYQHFCGNEWAAYHIYKATMDARVYEGKQQYEKAVGALIPYVFENGLASNHYLLEELIRILNSNFTKAEIQKELNNALSYIKLDKRKGTEVASIKLFGKSLVIYDYFFSAESDDQNLTGVDGYRTRILSNALFKAFLPGE